MKKVKITLSGGFHNCAPIKIMISADDAKALKNGDVLLSDILTKSQDIKLRNHFCGIKCCMCGSYTRASVEF